MQLSPLQSRLAASVIASCLLFLLYLLLFPPQFALAAELDLIPTTYDAAELAYEKEDEVDTSGPVDLRNPKYEPDFALFDRSIIGRAADNAITLPNNKLEKSNLAPGVSMTYVFLASSVSGREAEDTKDSVELRRSLNDSEGSLVDGFEDEDEDVTSDPELERRQQATKTLWISANTCEQPWPVSPAQTTVAPPQLTLYVSTSADNMSPGPLADANSQKATAFTEGAVMFNLSVDRDVYFSISAPNVSSDYFDTTKQYNFQLVASTEQYYYSYDTKADDDLIWVDSDARAALLQTKYLTNSSDQEISTLPYIIFAHNQDNVIINGMRNSYCGLSHYAQIRNLDDGSSGQVTMGLKKSGEQNLTRQEFYISGLNASSNYIGILARAPVESVTKRQDDNSGIGGGIVFQPTTFDTKPDGACTFIFNLTLCSETQYAVPGNARNFPDGTALASFYENYTQTMWDYFDKVMQQVPCETSSTAKYSLARDCDDCKTAYKNWLCSVAIPRCEDFSTPDRDSLQMRNIAAPFPNGSMVDQNLIPDFDNVKNLMAFNSSRNPSIDQVVQPGPYKELLPCDDLCYELVQSCPASMGFTCPRPGSGYSFNASYGRKNGSLSCNYPGSAHFPSGAGMISASCFGLAGLVGMFFMLAL
ncbi:stretch-activated Ca2+-permeable channel component-domain-containing protein [Hypoxylon cercidicola]|nr:stretch-activated Ca2+-permeable channel component-domain-containing protein [Hypoxylon cercidicola]